MLCFKTACAISAASNDISVVPPSSETYRSTNSRCSLTLAMPNTIPNFDFASRAQITRKALERLASFSKMQSGSSDPNPLLDRTLAKINGFVKLLDSSILTAHFAYQLAAAAMIVSDRENKEGVSIIAKDLTSLVSNGSDTAQEVATGFKEIEQAIYKIAASTKDNMLVVKIASDSAQTATVNKHLKDVGTDLVANLKLFGQFSRAAEEIADWWARIKKELVSDTPALLHLSPESSEPRPRGNDNQFDLWSSMKENLWEYYIIVNVVQLRFPDLLGPSIAAWQSTASARNMGVRSSEDADRQKSTSQRAKSVRRLLSRLKKRASNTKVKADSESEKEAKKVVVPTKGASSSDPFLGEHGRKRDGKIQRLFKACISAGPIDK